MVQRALIPLLPLGEGEGDEGLERNRKTLTDPASGEPQGAPPKPNRSVTDERDSQR